MALRVFLVDDHEVVRGGLRSLLEVEGDIEVVGEASTAEEAVTRGVALGPDVAVLDVRLPDGDGIGVCRELKSRLPDLQCLMPTSFADDEALLAAIMAGASGYVLKQIRGNDLVDAVRRVGNGRVPDRPGDDQARARSAPGRTRTRRAHRRSSRTRNGACSSSSPRA